MAGHLSHEREATSGREALGIDSRERFSALVGRFCETPSLAPDTGALQILTLLTSLGRVLF